MRIKYVFKESLARNLCNNGHNLISLRKDIKNKDRYVFLFEETERFIKEFTELSNKK